MDHVLVPHDLSDFSDRGLEALQHLEIPVRHVHVVHVLPRLDPSHPGLVWSKDEDELRQAHGRRALADRLAGLGFQQALIHVCVGDPAARITALAREIGASLVVVPSHGRTGLSRAVLGSVAEQVARFAPCPVLVVPVGVDVVRPPTPQAGPPTQRSPTEQVDHLGALITRRVAQTAGYLTAVRVALPDDADHSWWNTALAARLSAAGIDHVDLCFTPGAADQAEILDCRFEEQWSD